MVGGYLHVQIDIRWPLHRATGIVVHFTGPHFSGPRHISPLDSNLSSSRSLDAIQCALVCVSRPDLNDQKLAPSTTEPARSASDHRCYTTTHDIMTHVQTCRSKLGGMLSYVPPPRPFPRVGLQVRDDYRRAAHKSQATTLYIHAHPSSIYEPSSRSHPRMLKGRR